MKTLRLAVVLLLMLAPLTVAVAADANELLAKLGQSKPSWLFPANACPADVMSNQVVPVRYLGDRCIDRLGSCLAKCEKRDANACYASALAAKTLKKKAISEALFLRACELGVVSGCTNRAAGMFTEGGDEKCMARTFEKTCELDDPWGCTMFALHLSHGLGVKVNFGKAKRVLSKSCKYGLTDKACQYGKGVMKKIGEMEKSKSP